MTRLAVLAIAEQAGADKRRIGDDQRLTAPQFAHLIGQQVPAVVTQNT